MYMPEQHTAIKQPHIDASVKQIERFGTFETFLSEHQARKVRTETVNGYPSDVYEYEDPDSGHATVWVWQAHQMPVKFVLDGPEGVVTTEMSNIKLGVPLSDSLFVLPPGVQVMDPSAIPELEQMGGEMGDVLREITAGRGKARTQ